MKEIKKPIEPYKPIEPSKAFKEVVYLDIEEGETLESVLNKIPEGIKYSDIYTECVGYDGGFYFVYKIEVINPHYHTQYRQYQVNFATYQKQFEKYQKDFEKWRKFKLKQLELEKKNIEEAKERLMKEK